jgi:acid phosphatase (class A)
MASGLLYDFVEENHAMSLSKTVSIFVLLAFVQQASATVASVVESFPAPPAEGSVTDTADLEKVRAYQVSRTTADCDRTQHEGGLDIESTFGPPYGPLSEAEVSEVSSLYSDIFIRTDEYVNTIKQKYQRNRPFIRDSKIVLCAPSHPSTSYPSGHATISRVAANIFAKLFPQKAEALRARADQMAEDRVLGGVHHPSDIEAGKKLGDLVSEELLKDASFQPSMEATKSLLTKEPQIQH